MCCKCHFIARVIKNSDVSVDHVELSKNEHTCEPQLYQPYHKTIQKPNFELVKRYYRGVERNRLHIFTIVEGTKMFYELSWDTKELYICQKCMRSPHGSRYIRAHVITNADGKEYVNVSNKEHLCQPQTLDVIPQKIEANQFQLLQKRNVLGNIDDRLILFTSPEDHSKCYELKKRGSSFYCTKCLSKKETTACYSKWQK